MCVLVLQSVSWLGPAVVHVVELDELADTDRSSQTYFPAFVLQCFDHVDSSAVAGVASAAPIAVTASNVL